MLLASSINVVTLLSQNFLKLKMNKRQINRQALIDEVEQQKLVKKDVDIFLSAEAEMYKSDKSKFNIMQQSVNLQTLDSELECNKASAQRALHVLKMHHIAKRPRVLCLI